MAPERKKIGITRKFITIWKPCISLMVDPMAVASAANTTAINTITRNASGTARTLSGRKPESVLAVPLAFLVIVLIAVVFAALATAIGSTIKEMQGFQMVMNFLVMPIFFLSAAIYPLEGLPRALALLTRVDPLTYGVDGMRGLLTGRTHFGVALDIAVLLGVGVLFVIFGAWRFSKIEA